METDVRRNQSSQADREGEHCRRYRSPHDQRGAEPAITYREMRSDDEHQEREPDAGKCGEK